MATEKHRRARIIDALADLFETPRHSEAVYPFSLENQGALPCLMLNFDETDAMGVRIGVSALGGRKSLRCGFKRVCHSLKR